MEKNKCLEYYLDASIYSSQDIQKSIDETKKEFANKEVNVSITLNDFGMYVVTFQFKNKNTYWNRIKIRCKRKFQKPLLLDDGKKTRLEKYSGKNRYGHYKSTGTYRPYERKRREIV